MSSPFKNIIVIGPTGSIGSILLQALLNEPSFTVTALQRKSSKAKVDPRAKIIQVDDNYPYEDLVAAFANQDAVVNATTSLAVSEQFRFIDAAEKAGVKRYVASEYGLNNNRPEARALNSVFRQKGEVQDYLRAKSDKMEWMAIACGMWLKWSATHEFLGMFVRDRRFVRLDDGEGWFSCTTEANTALALVNALSRRWAETANRIVWISDFAITQNILLEELERATGTRFQVETVDSKALIEQKQAEVAAGSGSATYALIETGFVSGRFGGHLEKEGELMNEVLGLPKQDLSAVVDAAVAAVEAQGRQRR